MSNSSSREAPLVGSAKAIATVASRPDDTTAISVECLLAKPSLISLNVLAVNFFKKELSF